MTTAAQPLDAPRHGAPLPPPVIAYAVLTILAAVLPTSLAGFSPWTSTAALTEYFGHHHTAARLQAFLTIAAAIPLAVLSAIISDQLRAFGMQVPGRLIALLGGGIAAALLACSGMTTLALLSVSPGSGEQPILQFGQGFATALGGTAFAAFIGLLVAGMSITGLLGRLLPRPVAWFGLAIAVIGQLALLTTFTDTLNPLLPITRFGSLLYLLVAAVTLRSAAHSPR